jgi:small-conductance mechanosensitive channel
MASALGVQSVSFAAVLASMGLAVGMALSGQLQNLAGGVIIVVTKPFTIGNYIQAQNVEGIVQSVSLFHTVITTLENKKIYIPNGALSSGVIVNVNSVSERRLEWTIGIDYDSDVDKAIELLYELLRKDERVLNDPAPYVAVSALADSSVNLIARAWVKTEDFGITNHDFNRTVFLAFNEAGINFPFPQVTVSHR